MSKRVHVIGVVSALALLGGAWSASLLAPSDEDSVSAADVVAPVDGTITASFDESTAVEVARDAYTVTERDGTGLMRAMVSQQVSSVLRDGTWVPISTDLTKLEDGAISAEDHPLEPVFALVWGGQPGRGSERGLHVVPVARRRRRRRGERGRRLE